MSVNVIANIDKLIEILVLFLMPSQAALIVSPSTFLLKQPSNYQLY